MEFATLDDIGHIGNQSTCASGWLRVETDLEYRTLEKGLGFKQ